jgi:predicted transposase/invertase (TIGR01784 family)
MRAILTKMRSTLDPTLDVVFKMLFATPGSKDCLISLLSAVLRPVVPISDIEILNPDIPKQDLHDKGIILDILVRLVDGSQIDVEMQARRRAAFPKRVLFYWARRYSSQIGPGAGYEELRPVIMVVFTSYRELRAKRLHSTFRLLEIRDHTPFHRDLEIHLIELPELAMMSDDERQDEQALVRWSTFLAAKTDEEVEQVAKGDKMIEKAKEILEYLSKEPDARELARLRQEGQLWYQMDLAEERREGEATGRVEAKREMLFMLLERQKISLTDERMRLVGTCDDTSRLDQWIRSTLTAESAEEIFD